MKYIIKIMIGLYQPVIIIVITDKIPNIIIPFFMLEFHFENFNEKSLILEFIRYDIVIARIKFAIKVLKMLFPVFSIIRA